MSGYHYFPGSQTHEPGHASIACAINSATGTHYHCNCHHMLNNANKLELMWNCYEKMPKAASQMKTCCTVRSIQQILFSFRERIMSYCPCVLHTVRCVEVKVITVEMTLQDLSPLKQTNSLVKSHECCAVLCDLTFCVAFCYKYQINT